MKYLLKLGKASLHRYPVGEKFCRNPTSKFLFYEENGLEKYLYISIVLYVYLMSLYFQFCFAFFVKNLKIEYDPHFLGRRKFLEIVESRSLRYPAGRKISTKSLHLTRLRRHKQFCVLLVKKIVNA